MTNIARSGGVFLDTAHTGPAWELVPEQIARPLHPEAPWEVAREEMAVRDLLARYTYALDRGDVDSMLQFFTDDCVIRHPRGTFSGRAAIRADLDAHIRGEDHRLHHWSNVVVRFAADLQDAVLTANFLAILQPAAKPAKWVGGLSVDQLVKRNGQWRIRHRTTTVDFAAAAVAPPAE